MPYRMTEMTVRQGTDRSVRMYIIQQTDRSLTDRYREQAAVPHRSEAPLPRSKP